MNYSTGLATPISPAVSDDRETASSRSNVLAVVEGVVLLGGLTLLDLAGVIVMDDWPVHPMLFAVVLLSAQYGIYGGILAAMGAIMLSHIGGWPARPVDMSYATYFRIAWADSLSWVAAGLMVGVVTSRKGKALRDTSAQLRQSKLAESLIATQYQILSQRTHKLERSVAGLTDTLTTRETRSSAPARKERASTAASRKR
ncbi:hypothetical protein [Devosia lacusdianchii]|uniref:hypothetical protein n=1 Tax=Devosia lacusdianchii TaxID=2917991 RepID=UPI001F061A3B|nr:hypothetical protein [Devosia sp. JXJ CY 41]